MTITHEAGLAPEKFAFTIEAMLNHGSGDNSGHYVMVVDHDEAIPTQIMGITEVSLMQGKLSARIDLKCFLSHKLNGDGSIAQKDVGKVSFFLMKGQSKLHQTIDLPFYDETREGDAEIFAVWTPTFKKISPQFFTDANGFDITTREIYD